MVDRASPQKGREYVHAYSTVRLHRGGNGMGFYVPRKVREELNFEPGDYLAVYVVGKIMCAELFDGGIFRPRVNLAMIMPDEGGDAATG